MAAVSLFWNNNMATVTSCGERGGGDLTLEPPNCKSSALTAQLPPAAM